MHQEREPELPRGVAFKHFLDRDEVLETLGHLAAGDRQMTRVEEVTDPVVVAMVRLRQRKKTFHIYRVSAFCGFFFTLF